MVIKDLQGRGGGRGLEHRANWQPGGHQGNREVSRREGNYMGSHFTLELGQRIETGMENI